MRRKAVINLAQQPGAIYSVPVSMRALGQSATDALAAIEQACSPFRRPELTIRRRAVGDGSYIVRLTDRAQNVHRFRGTYFDVHPWLRRLARECAAIVTAERGRLPCAHSI